MRKSHEMVDEGQGVNKRKGCKLYHVISNYTAYPESGADHHTNSTT
jgi:hypothetical protein